MSDSRVRVKHCILATGVTKFGIPSTYNLLGVTYYWKVPADTEFPYVLSQADLFLRFYIQTGKLIQVRIKQWG